MNSGGKNLAEKGFFVKILNRELPEAPISKLLGSKYLEFDQSSQVLKVEMQARPDFVNPAGFIHGGMLAAMLDETLSPTLALTLGPDRERAKRLSESRGSGSDGEKKEPGRVPVASAGTAASRTSSQRSLHRSSVCN
jgi:hypothetical protein